MKTRDEIVPRPGWTTRPTASRAGRPVDSQGEFVGVVIDRVRESLASDWVLVPSKSRAIDAHASGLIQLLERAGADAILGGLEF